MTLVVQLSDPHLRLGAEEEAALSALQDAVAVITALPEPPDAVLLTGDVADTAHPDEYAQAEAALAPIQAPLHVLPGNHDDRAEVAARWPTPEAAVVGGLRLVMHDTTIPGEAGGRLDPERLAMVLSDDGQTPTIVALHHPPVFTGIALLDEIGLAPGDRAALAKVLLANPQVARVVAGHVHRSSTETLGGCAVVTCPSTHRQAEPDPGPEGVRFVTRGRALLFHHLRGRGVISHLQPI